MPSLYVNTYAPLVASPHGVAASRDRGIPPFVDGSIRREPDLEHERPSITCICRGANFAPRLRLGDVIVYMTKKGDFGRGAGDRRATAVLRVAALLADHPSAARWYRDQGLPLPSNCMVNGNPPCDVAESHACNDECEFAHPDFAERWDEGYRGRAAEHRRFVVCERLWSELGWNAPRVHDVDLESVFGRVPGTRNPGRLPLTLLEPLLARLGIDATPSGPRTPRSA